MTAGHRHRVVRLRRRGLLYRALTVRLATTTDTARVDRSRWVWGPDPRSPRDDQQLYMLRPLGVLHTLTGLEVAAR